MQKVRSSLIAALVSWLVATSVLLGTNVVGYLHGHSCVGEGCETCQTLRIANDALSTPLVTTLGHHMVLVSTGCAIAWAYASRASRTAEAARTGMQLMLQAKTPVQLKVKLLL